MTRAGSVLSDDLFAALWERHTQGLRFKELRRAVQALSSAYVEHRDRMGRSALESAGKRAAFAVFYGTLHYLLVREVVQELDAARKPLTKVLDLGCGTLMAGAAWGVEAGSSVMGVDRNAWAVREARWTLRQLGLSGTARQADLSSQRLPGGSVGIVAAFAVNEVADETRNRLMRKMFTAAGQGARILVIEPLSKRVAPWWGSWTKDFCRAGGRVDEWKLAVDLPEQIRKLDEAAGLDHRELKGRSLYLDGSV